jgi:hypothetical protein
MYLYAEKYVSGYDYETINGEITRVDNPMYDEIIKSAGMDNLPTSEYGNTTVTKQVGYWRKANAIHGWIVRNLAEGVDECQRINISRESLVLLRDSCVKELDNRANALPNKEGTRTINLDEGDSPEDTIRSLIEDMQGEFAKRHTAVNVADPLSLEPTAGFFFGGTEKDEWYYETIEYTVDTINSLLAGTTDEDYSFYYQASW